MVNIVGAPAVPAVDVTAAAFLWTPGPKVLPSRSAGRAVTPATRPAASPYAAVTALVASTYEPAPSYFVPMWPSPTNVYVDEPVSPRNVDAPVASNAAGVTAPKVDAAPRSTVGTGVNGALACTAAGPAATRPNVVAIAAAVSNAALRIQPPRRATGRRSLLPARTSCVFFSRLVVMSRSKMSC